MAARDFSKFPDYRHETKAYILNIIILDNLISQQVPFALSSNDWRDMQAFRGMVQHLHLKLLPYIDKVGKGGKPVKKNEKYFKELGEKIKTLKSNPRELYSKNFSYFEKIESLYELAAKNFYRIPKFIPARRTEFKFEE